MGSTFEFTCPDCGYHVDGMATGFDRGFVAQVHAVTCHDCRELRVAHIGGGWDEDGNEVRRVPEPVDLTAVALRCPESEAHRVTPWTHPGPCPRCGSILEQGQLQSLWD